MVSELISPFVSSVSRVTFAFICIYGTCFGQDSTQTYKEWINGGIGFGSPFETWGLEKISYGITYNFGWNYVFYQLGYNVVRQPVSGEGVYSEEIVNLNIGVRDSRKWTHLSLFVGPGFGSVRTPNGRTKTIMGLSVNAQGFLKPLRELGIGIDVYGNLNTVRNVFAIRFALHLTNLR